MGAVLLCGVVCAAIIPVFGIDIITSTEKYTEPDVPLTTTSVAKYDPTTTPLTFTTPTYVPYFSKPSYFEAPRQCNNEITGQIIADFRHAIYTMSVPICKKLITSTAAHMVYSPYTIWLSLAAVAEGCVGETQKQLFKFLSLPEDACLRQAYYHLAVLREHASNDVVFRRNRMFITDSSVHVNEYWANYIKTHTHLNTLSVPFQTDATEIEQLKKDFNVELPNVDLSGNSLILDSLDYHGLWTSAFSDATVKQGPFYNSFGQQIGIVEYMNVYKPVYIGVSPEINMKYIEIPVGRDGRYRMYFAVSLSQSEDFEHRFDQIQDAILTKVLEASTQDLKLSPVEIVIPRMKISSEIDMRHVLEEIGIRSLWVDPLATRNISDPAAIPSAFTQRVTVTIDGKGVRPVIQEYQNFVPPLQYTSSGFAPTYSGYSNTYATKYKPVESFVANKPFIFSLFDAETLTFMFFGAFSRV